MISLLSGILKSKINEQTKPSENKHIDTENRIVVPTGERGVGRAKGVKGVNCMVTDGN